MSISRSYCASVSSYSRRHASMAGPFSTCGAYGRPCKIRMWYRQRDKSASRAELDRHVADRQTAFDRHGADHWSRVLHDMAHAGIDTVGADQMQDDILGIGARGRLAVEVHSHRPRLALKQAPVSREPASPRSCDAPGPGTDATAAGGVAVAADVATAWQRIPRCGATTCTMPWFGSPTSNSRSPNSWQFLRICRLRGRWGPKLSTVRPGKVRCRDRSPRRSGLGGALQVPPAAGRRTLARWKPSWTKCRSI